MSEVKVNKISPRTNCGTVTLGDSGDTFTIPAGVTLTNSGTATGFGPTGAVSWNTTKITANPNPAVSGVGYFCDTSSAAFTVTLPAAPSAGAIIGIRDYAQTFATNNLTVGRNSQPIDGQTFNLILNTNGDSVILIYVDATQGWKSISSNEIVNQAEFVAATGGTITTCGNYKIHSFTGPGTFTVTNAGNPAGSSTVDYLVIAGAGSGNGEEGGGGGAGGFRESVPSPAAWTASPLANPGGALPVSTTGYPITVGAGGAGPTSGSPGNQGNNSIFSTITSAGGGFGGGSGSPSFPSGTSGGSGGGGLGCGSGITQPGSSGNTPPVAPSQGNPGGNGIGRTGPGGLNEAGGGGGGAGSAGVNATNNGGPGAGTGGNGGSGATTSISGSPTTYAGGGGGGVGQSPGTAGSGGSPTAGAGRNSTGTAGAGTANSGSGGGGGGGNAGPNVAIGGAGGSGIVVIRYKFQ